MADPWAEFRTAPAPAPAEADPWADFRPASAPAETPTSPRADRPKAVDSTFMDVLTSAEDGIRQGVSAVVGLPVDAVNNAPRLANLLPGVDDVGPISETPVGGSASIDNLLRFGGLVPDYEPQTGPGKFANRAAEDVGASLVPVGLGGLLAKLGYGQVPATGNRAQRTVTNISNNMARPMAAAPTRTASKEMAYGMAAGTGAATGGAVTDDSWWGELLGSLLGVGTLAAGTGIFDAAKDVGNAVFGGPGSKYASRVVNENVADTLLANSDTAARGAANMPEGAPVNADPLIDALTAPAQIEGAIPGYQASSANRTGDAGLSALEEARSRGGTNTQRYKDRNVANQQSIEDALSEVAPTQPSQRFSGELALERDRRLMDAGTAAQNAEGAADVAAEGLNVTTTRAERGGAIREGFDTAREAARTETREAYAPFDEMTQGAQGSGAALKTAVDEAQSTLTETRKGLLPESVISRVTRLVGDETPAQPSGLLDQYGNPMMGQPTPPADIDIQEVLDLDSELGRLQRAAQADPRAEKGGRNAAEAIGRVRDALNTFVDGSLTPEQRTALADAKAAKTREADAFGRPGTLANRALADYEGGAPKMSDERVASEAINPSSMDETFSKAGSPPVRKAVEEEVVSRGDFSSSKSTQKFLADYQEQLSRLPEAEKAAKDVQAKRGTQEELRAAYAEMERDIGENGTGAVAKYLQYGDEVASRAMARVLSTGNKRPAETVDELLSFIGDDPQAVQGARKAFWDVMEDRGRSNNLSTLADGETMAWNAKKWKAFLDDEGTRAAAERLYRDDPEQLARIDEIATVLREAGVLPASTVAKNPSGTQLMGKGAGMTLAEVQAKGYEVARGRVNPLYMVTYLAGRIARRATSSASARAYEMALDRALIDPEFAAKLLAENNPANRAALRQSAKGWMGAEASNAMVNDLATQDTQDDVENALGGADR